MNGLYYYKLVSKYPEDVTKECKLTINEIDHNFITLKDADIKDAKYCGNENRIILTKNNGENIVVDLSELTCDLVKDYSVDYDKKDGIIKITYNNEEHIIDGLITQENLLREIPREILTKDTISGNGTKNKPLGIALADLTGTYKPVQRLIDKTEGEQLPHTCSLGFDDRYVVHEGINLYGLLYNFKAVKAIECDLSDSCWRVPTKEDWDNMLNAIEICDKDRNHDSKIANIVLGKNAGKELKSKNWWKNCDSHCICDSEETIEEEIEHKKECNCHEDKPEFEYAWHKKHNTQENHKNEHDCHHEDRHEFDYALHKKHDPRGIDEYGMTILPSGYGDGCRMFDYFGRRGEFWTSTVTDAHDIYTKRFDNDKCGVVQCLESGKSVFSLRLVKDYNGSNYQEIETINGVDYPTVLMPSQNTKYGHSIWTSVNISFDQPKYHPIIPNHGEGIEHAWKDMYCIYAWDGKKWIKREMSEGESVVILDAPNSTHATEYRLIQGELKPVDEILSERVVELIQPTLDGLNEKIEANTTEILNINNNITILSGSIETISETVDTLSDKVDTFIEKTEAEIDRIDQINSEQDERIDSIDEKLNAEIERSTAKDEEIEEALTEEKAERIAKDEELSEKLNAEIERSTAKDEEIEEALAEEKAERIAKDEELSSYIITSGSTYDNINGILTLTTRDEKNNIIIALNSDFGTF